MAITIREITEQNSWEQFQSQLERSNILQSWQWGLFQKELGRKVFFLGAFKDENIVATCLAYIVPTKLRTHLYTSNGPVLADWQDARTVFPPLLSELKRIAKENGAKFVRVDPLILDTRENQQLLTTFNLTRAKIHTQSERKWILDITPELDTILANMRKNVRYSVRKSEEQDLQVHFSNDTKDFDKFWPLFETTFTSRGFIPQPKWYLKKQVESFNNNGGDYRIYWVTSGERILATALFPFHGNTAFYFHAATDNTERKLFAAYAMIWNVIKSAKELGMKHVDFWGIAPTDDPKHPWAGLTFFKTGFGGFEERVIRGYDLPVSPMYKLISFLESTRNIWGKLYFKVKGK